jgi:hypothetical protein
MHEVRVYRWRTAELGRTGYELGYRAEPANRVFLDMAAFYYVYDMLVAGQISHHSPQRVEMRLG